MNPDDPTPLCPAQAWTTPRPVPFVCILPRGHSASHHWGDGPPRMKTTEPDIRPLPKGWD